ncbi:hypothetical protein ABW19_dt0205378 [Dactylella cylindrospora]|nr:hypothetical protein ABW19_dt0205378 [Dactylella cylindrospora]
MPDLSYLPAIYILSARLDDTQRLEVISNVKSKGCVIAPSPREASIFIGDVLGARRASLELKSLGIPTTDITKAKSLPTTGKILKVVKIEWYKQAVLEGVEVDIEDFVIYRGHFTGTQPCPKQTSSPAATRKRSSSPISAAAVEAEEHARRQAILQRAMADQMASNRPSAPGSRHWGHGPSQPKAKELSSSQIFKPPKLVHQQSTESHDEAEEIAENLPEMPLWVKNKELYSCTRLTPKSPPEENKPFIDALFKIRLNRILISDEVGVRAYSTAIASISAFPYPLTHISQLHSMPGCEKKIAALWYEFTHSDPPGRIEILDEIENSSYYKTLELFYNVWGAGAHSARNFYRLGFRDLDDLVEHHWKSLTRVQQIGVKYYEEFEIKIPRDEVVLIRDAIRDAARELLPGVEAAIVGGYRRGKELSNDVDILLTHPRVSKSRDVEELLIPLVDKLEADGLITHVLTIHTPSRHVANIQGDVFPKRSHHNFDGIPKVLCVWQQPDTNPWEDDEGDSQMGNMDASSRERRRNPNPHRRVDILFPPPRCAGSTLTSWSGANTFERDLRRYVKHKYFWKFSSEGITNRANGKRMAIGKESGEFIGLTEEQERNRKTIDDDVEKRERKEDGEWVGWEVEERKLFKVLELEWREPTERCTG